jgi:competence ComEA-like helix-hairpin-helix protein
MKDLLLILLIVIITSFPLYGEKVDINSANFEELIKLPGIDELMAAKIYKYREQHRFSSIYDLMKVDGMTGEKFQNLISMITVEGGKKTPKEDVKNIPVKKKIKKNDNLPSSPRRISGLSRGRISSGSGLRRISRQKFTPMSIFKAGFGLARRGKFKMAERLFTQFLEKNPTHRYASDAQYLKASCYEEMGMFKKAIELYKKVYNNKYSRVRGIALFRIGICYDLMKDYNNAILKYVQFIKEFPESQWVKTADDRLKELN